MVSASRDRRSHRCQTQSRCNELIPLDRTRTVSAPIRDHRSAIPLHVVPPTTTGPGLHLPERQRIRHSRESHIGWHASQSHRNTLPLGPTTVTHERALPSNCTSTLARKSHRIEALGVLGKSRCEISEPESRVYKKTRELSCLSQLLRAEHSSPHRWTSVKPRFSSGYIHNSNVRFILQTKPYPPPIRPT